MDKTVVIAGDLNLDAIIDGEIDDRQLIDGQPFPYYSGPGSGTYEHDRLIHREYPNQHTISSITSLESALGSRPSDVITNMDIYNILSH